MAGSFGPYTREEFARLAAKPYGGAADEIRRSFDPLFGLAGEDPEAWAIVAAFLDDHPDRAEDVQDYAARLSKGSALSIVRALVKAVESCGARANAWDALLERDDEEDDDWDEDEDAEEEARLQRAARIRADRENWQARIGLAKALGLPTPEDGILNAATMPPALSDLVAQVKARLEVTSA